MVDQLTNSAEPHEMSFLGAGSVRIVDALKDGGGSGMRLDLRTVSFNRD